MIFKAFLYHSIYSCWLGVFIIWLLLFKNVLLLLTDSRESIFQIDTSVTNIPNSINIVWSSKLDLYPIPIFCIISQCGRNGCAIVIAMSARTWHLGVTPFQPFRACLYFLTVLYAQPSMSSIFTTRLLLFNRQTSILTPHQSSVDQVCLGLPIKFYFCIWGRYSFLDLTWLISFNFCEKPRTWVANLLT